MKRQIVILLFCSFLLSNCDLSNLGEFLGAEPLENCDTLNIPSMDVVWEKDLALNNKINFSPITYENYVLTADESTMYFLNKETGVVEKELTLNFPAMDNPDFRVPSILQGNFFIKDDLLVYHRYFLNNVSFSADSLFTETLNLETGEISTLYKSTAATDGSPFNRNFKLHLINDSYLKYESVTLDELELKLINIFDGSEFSLVTTTALDFRRSEGNTYWQDGSGDIMVAVIFDGDADMLVRVFNATKNQLAFELDVPINVGTRALLKVENDVLYVRGLTQFVAIDITNQSLLWQQDELDNNSLGIDYNHNFHITDNTIIDYSRGNLTIFDKSSGSFLFEHNRMPSAIILERTPIHGDELIVMDEESLFRLEMNRSCIIWQNNEPIDNQGYRSLLTLDEATNQIYAIRDGKMVCIQL